MTKYIKQGSNKYPKKAAKKGGVGEDHPSPKLEMMGGIQMVENECDSVREAGGGVMKLWGKGQGCRSGGWECRRRVTHHYLPQPPEE